MFSKYVNPFLVLKHLYKKTCSIHRHVAKKIYTYTYCLSCACNLHKLRNVPKCKKVRNVYHASVACYQGDFSVVELPCLKREKLFFCGNFISGQITWFVVDGKYERVSVMWIFNQNSWNHSAFRPTACVFIYWPPNNLWIFYASTGHVLVGVLLLLPNKSWCRFAFIL